MIRDDWSHVCHFLHLLLHSLLYLCLWLHQDLSFQQYSRNTWTSMTPGSSDTAIRVTLTMRKTTDKNFKRKPRNPIPKSWDSLWANKLRYLPWTLYSKRHGLNDARMLPFVPFKVSLGVVHSKSRVKVITHA